MSESYLHLTPFLSAEDADSMLRIAQSVGSFGTYADEATSDGLGEALPQRFDAGLNYIQGGIDGTGNEDDAQTAGSRTNYFRETYAYGEQVQAEGIQAFMAHPALNEKAAEMTASRIVPAIVYANLLVPGQELAIHTDVPEFRGASRKSVPQWLLVCMLHSGLFEAWRIPILTCVSWFGTAEGGAFTFYPDGVDAPRQSIAAGHNTAIIIDTDKVFHGVERVCRERQPLPTVGQHTRLHFCGDDQWELREGEQVLARYEWSQLRYSISWKAYCFADERSEQQWRQGGDSLDLETILAVFEKELTRRGVLQGPRPDPTDFALLMVEHFVRFPKLATAS